jgi:hypothetical protein
MRARAYPANTSNRGLNGEINRASLCPIAEKARITPPTTQVYTENGKKERPRREKGR